MKRFIIFAALAVAGCGTSLEYIHTNAPPRALTPRPADQVEVFSTKMPERPYVEVGIIESQQSSLYSLDNADAVFTQLREVAGRQGCDAILVLGSNDAEVSSRNGNGGTKKGYRATCAVYKDATAAR